MKLTPMHSRAEGDAANTTPALLGFIAAILLWYGGEHLRDQLPPLVQQLKAASMLVQRGGGSELSGLKSDVSQARGERLAIEFRMRSDDTEQMARARLVFDLRARCGAARLQSCSVRLSEETGSAQTSVADTKADKSGARDGETTLASLGIQKARAIVSGTFGGDDLGAFVDALRNDGTAQWRVNGLVVRGNTFELDVERHIRPATVATEGVQR